MPFDTYDYEHEQEIQDILESTMFNYIDETKEKGFVPYFTQFCEVYYCENNEKNLKIFERIMAMA